MKLIAIALLLSSTCLSTSLGANDGDKQKSDKTNWPQWRGPDRNGVSGDTNIIQQFPKDGPRILWKHDFFDGYSSISVQNDDAMTMYTVGNYEYTISLDANTGYENWRVNIGPIFLNGQGTGPRSTPLIDGDRVFVIGGHARKLFSLRTYDGHISWAVDLKKGYKIDVPRWGYAASPLRAGDNIIIPVDGNVNGKRGFGLVAFDRNTGDLKWECFTSLPNKPKDRMGYSSPIKVVLHGQEQIVMLTARQLIGVDLEGKLLWQHKWATRRAANVATPLVIPGNKIFLAAGHGKGSTLVKILRNETGYSTQTIWRNKVLKSKFSSSVYVNGHIFGFGKHRLKCIDPATGIAKWETGGFSHGSLLFADNQFIVFSENGRLALVDASPDNYLEKDEVRILGSYKSWTAPSLANGKLYIRNQRRIICLDMRPDQMVKGNDGNR